jgi:purine-binding chemotaxis protein CheW
VGLLNLRGQIMPVVDLRRVLRFPERGGEEGKLLVLRAADPFSVLVDEIGDVLELPETDWQSAPDTLAAEHRGFVSGVCPIIGHLLLGLRVASLVGAGDPAPGRADAGA